MTYHVPQTGTFEEWDEWEIEMKLNHPVQYFLRWRLPILLSRFYRWVWKDPVYYTKCLLWHRYNVIRIREIGPTWCDRDALIFYACFQIFQDFIEKERCWEFKATDAELAEAYGVKTERIKDWAEIRELYDWWMNWDREEEDEMQPQLLKLIEHRGYFWT